MAEQSLKRQLKVLTIPVFIEMALVMLLALSGHAVLSAKGVGASSVSFVIKNKGRA